MAHLGRAIILTWQLRTPRERTQRGLGFLGPGLESSRTSPVTLAMQPSPDSRRENSTELSATCGLLQRPCLPSLGLPYLSPTPYPGVRPCSCHTGILSGPKGTYIQLAQTGPPGHPGGIPPESTGSCLCTGQSATACRLPPGDSESPRCLEGRWLLPGEGGKQWARSQQQLGIEAPGTGTGRATSTTPGSASPPFHGYSFTDIL